MSRYRKTMRQAIEEGLSNMQITILKKEYAPFKGKTISAARAKQLMNILDKFKEADLKKLSTAGIPFVSSGAGSKLAVRNMKFKVTTINPFKEEVTQEDFDLEEGKMKTIATMFSQGKSAEEIAKKMKLPVATVKSILGEVKEETLPLEGHQSFIHEFKKMTVTIRDMDKRKKAIADLMKQNLGVSVTGGVIKVDGKGKDLNNFAKDLMNFYGANVRAECYTMDESADEDFYNPVTEACWTGYKQVGMKDKGGKKVPNCVPESVEEDKKKSKKDIAPDGEAEHAEKKDIKEEEDPKKLENELKQKENEIAALKQKAETDKAKNVAKATDKMVNPETGEPLLQVGIAYKHLRQKMAKDAAARDDAEQKEKEEKKKTLAKFKDRIKEEALVESDASDKAKAMGLDYMKFGRYGKDGKVTHISKGGGLVKVNDKGEPVKDDEPKKDEPSKDEPKADVKPKIDKFDAQKDLEGMVTDGMIDVEDDGQGGLTATKEYEPSQDYEAERDVKSIKQYFKDKGIDEKDIYVDVESEEDYIQVNVEIRGKKVDEADLSKSQIKKVHKMADELPKKDFKDRYGKEKGDAVRYATATNMVKKKLGIGEEMKEHPAKAVYEQIAGLKKKAEKSGMPYSILKKVYDRGMAAWRGGHRPGTTQQQWAFARVNSFVTKSSGTWGGADKDLAKQVRGGK